MLGKRDLTNRTMETVGMGKGGGVRKKDEERGELIDLERDHWKNKNV